MFYSKRYKRIPKKKISISILTNLVVMARNKSKSKPSRPDGKVGGRRGKARHTVKKVFTYDDEDNRGYVYTKGVSSLHPSKVEFISLNCSRTKAKKAEALCHFLVNQILCGDLVCENQLVDFNGTEWSILGYRDYVNKALLEGYATDCDGDVKLLVLEPSSNSPFTLPIELADKTLECLECGAKEGGEIKLLRCTQCKGALYCSARCQHAGWSSHRTECRENTINNIREKWRNKGVKHSKGGRSGTVRPSSGNAKVTLHPMIHETFNVHPSGLPSRERGMFIRHINGDKSDNRAINLVDCHPYVAFTRPEFEVDWKMDLTEQEVSFVNKNLAMFAEMYKASYESGEINKF